MKNLTIEPIFVPQGKGNNPDAGQRDLHYKIKEWGYIFPTEEAAKNYADTHKVNERGFIEEIQNVPSEDN
jgi:hypothetical protein